MYSRYFSYQNSLRWTIFPLFPSFELSSSEWTNRRWIFSELRMSVTHTDSPHSVLPSLASFPIRPIDPYDLMTVQCRHPSLDPLFRHRSPLSERDKIYWTPSNMREWEPGRRIQRDQCDKTTAINITMLDLTMMLMGRGRKEARRDKKHSKAKPVWAVCFHFVDSVFALRRRSHRRRGRLQTHTHTSSSFLFRAV